MTVIGPSTGYYNPMHPSIHYTDHAGVDVNVLRARFTRPLVFLGYENAAPGARIRFRTDAPTCTAKLYMNNLAPDNGTNSIALYIDGVWSQDLTPARGVAMEYDVALAGSGYRLVEFVLPFAAGVDFLGVVMDPRWHLLPPLPRPPILLAVGDSITHGFEATLTRNTWAFRLAQAKGMQLVNMGFGSSSSVHHIAGDNAGALQPAKIITALGHNDFGGQVALATFKSNMTTIINIWLAETSAHIYVVLPFWTSLVKAITIAQYRTALTEAVAAIGSGRISVIDGEPLALNSTAHFPDGIHPNDAGSLAIANALALVI